VRNETKAAVIGGTGLFGCLAVMLTVCLSMGIIGAFTWPYSINTFLVMADKEPVVVWWHGFLLGLCPVVGEFTIPAAVVTWVVTLFV
jgi:hypothetical protein